MGQTATSRSYNLNGGTWGAIGAVGGIMSTANGHIPGQLPAVGSATPYFNHPFNSEVLGDPGDCTLYLPGLAVDGIGNIYVVDSDTRLEKYDQTGKLLWSDAGLVFFGTGTIDPTNQNSVYTSITRCGANWTQPPAGGMQPTFAGYDAYTLDAVTYQADDCRVACNYQSVNGMFSVNGSKFLALGGNDSLEIYRFSGSSEIAIPCDFFSDAQITSGFIPPNQPANTDYLWCDTNGDGQIESGEYLLGNQSALYGSGNIFKLWSVDANGGIWIGECGSSGNQLVYFPCQGLNSYGVPIYTYTSMQTITVPAPFASVNRAFYNPTANTMYLIGNSANDAAFWTANCACIAVYGGLVGYYSNWSTTPTLVWQDDIGNGMSSAASDGTFLFGELNWSPGLPYSYGTNYFYTFGPGGYLGAFATNYPPLPANAMHGLIDGPYAMNANQLHQRSACALYRR